MAKYLVIEDYVTAAGEVQAGTVLDETLLQDFAAMQAGGYLIAYDASMDPVITAWAAARARSGEDNAPSLGAMLEAAGIVVATVTDYAGAKSKQTVAADMNVAAGVGKAVAAGTAFIAAVMGNLIGDALTKTGNYLAGLIGHYTVTGAKATHYPAGAVLAGIGDGVTEADGCVVAYVDGDSALTKAGAALKVRCNNSTAGSGLDFGVDLQDAAHDGFLPVDAAFYKKAPVRLPGDIVMLTGAGVPVDGVAGTGAGVAGPGSLYFRTGAGSLYVNGGAGTQASPVWKLVTQAA